MPFTLAYLLQPASPVPAAPEPGCAIPGRPADRQEHFGSEEAALRRAAVLLPAADALDLRLYGPDGCRIACQSEIAGRLGLQHPAPLQGSRP